MNLKIIKDKVRILEPFAVFFIITGIGINVIVPFVSALGKINPATRAEAVKIIWSIAAVSALSYSIFILRYLLKQSVLDRFLYFLMAAIFATLVVVIYLPWN